VGIRDETKRQTRQKLVEAGIELFARDGLDRPSLDAICAHAGFTRGAFYVHFSDREDFLVAVMEQAGGPILDAILTTDPESDFSQVVTRFLAAAMDGTYPLTPQGGVRPHQLLDACARSERVRELYVRLIADSIERLGATLSHSQGGGTVRADLDPHATATMLLALVIGAQTMMELGAPLDLAAVSGALLAMLTRAGPGHGSDSTE